MRIAVQATFFFEVDDNEDIIEGDELDIFLDHHDVDLVRITDSKAGWKNHHKVKSSLVDHHTFKWFEGWE